tara:strand:+ start:526 stop:948 length:423 start_codon:yes stop_codon:yes gene_type:complete
MNKDELKKVLKPLVKQCINEVLLEEGILSTVIAEVMKGTASTRIVETKQPKQKPQIDNSAAQEAKRKRLLEQKRKLLDSIGTDAYNGVNVFEGTTPTRAGPSPGQPQTQGPLSDIAPSDPGVDISSLMGSAHNWKKVVGK